MHPKFAAIAVDAVFAYSCTTDSAWVFAWTLHEVQACTVPQIMTFVFPAFTLNPFFSMASFHIKSLLTHSSRESAMMTRSSVHRTVFNQLLIYFNLGRRWPLLSPLADQLYILWEESGIFYGRRTCFGKNSCLDMAWLTTTARTKKIFGGGNGIGGETIRVEKRGITTREKRLGDDRLVSR